MDTQNQSSAAPSEATQADESGAAPSVTPGAPAAEPLKAPDEPQKSPEPSVDPGSAEEIAKLSAAAKAELAATHQRARDALEANDKAFSEKVLAKSIELDRIQSPAADQVVKIRAGLNSHRLGLVIRRANGDYTAEQLGHRTQPEITLEPGDQLLIAPLGGDNLRDFMRMADMTPGEKDPDVNAGGEDEVAASPGGTA